MPKSDIYSGLLGESELLPIGKQMLTHYFHSNSMTPIKAEGPFRLPLIHLKTQEKIKPTIECWLDLICKNDEIIEFNTPARTLNESDANDSLQLTCYCYGYEMLYQKRPKLF